MGDGFGNRRCDVPSAAHQLTEQNGKGFIDPDKNNLEKKFCEDGGRRLGRKSNSVVRLNQA